MSRQMIAGFVCVAIAMLCFGSDFTIRTIIGGLFLGFGLVSAFLDGVHHARKEANR